MTHTAFKPLHPIERAGALDSRFRRLFQDPDQILKPHIRPGMHVLDLGCGTGYFSLSLARLVQSSGRVTAVDVQTGMLNRLRSKLKGHALKGRIHIHQNAERSLRLTGTFDFVLAFYSMHEVKYLDSLLEELKRILKPKARILMVEQKFHVPRSTFEGLVLAMQERGFVVLDRPKVCFSRAVLFASDES